MTNPNESEDKVNVSTKRQRFNSTAPNEPWNQCEWQNWRLVLLITLGCCITQVIPSDTAINTGSTTAKSANTANLSGMTLRVVKLKGGWDIHIKLGGLHKFPYQIKNIVDSNVVIVAAPFAIADPEKKAAISDFLCRIKNSQVPQNTPVKKRSQNHTTAIKVDEATVVYQDANVGLVLPISD